MRRSTGQRTAAILLAVLVQGTLITPYLLSRRQRAAREPEVPAMVFIQPVRTTEVSPPARSNRRSSSRVAAPLVPADRGTDPEPRAIQSITLPREESPRTDPRVDWHATIESVARDVIKQKTELEQHGNPLDSKPKVLQLPKLAPEEPAIVAERLGNGDLITRYRVTDDITVICEHRQIPLSQHFEALARSAPAICRASDRSKAVDLSSVKPGYLKKPLPKPRAAEDRSGTAIELPF